MELDLIKEQMAFDYSHSADTSTDHEADIDKAFKAGFDACHGLITNQWIKVSDKMPKHNVGVLVFIQKEDFHITAGMWDISNKWVLLDEYRVPDCEVTHWMGLPDIPQEYHRTL